MLFFKLQTQLFTLYLQIMKLITSNIYKWQRPFWEMATALSNGNDRLRKGNRRRRHHHHYYHYHYHYHCLAPGLLAIIFSVGAFRMPLSVQTQSPLKARASWILRKASEQTAYSIWFHVLDKPYPTHIRIKQEYLAWSVVYEYLSSYWLTEVHHWPILAIVVGYSNTMQTWDPSRAGFLSPSARSWCISKKTKKATVPKIHTSPVSESRNPCFHSVSILQALT